MIFAATIFQSGGLGSALGSPLLMMVIVMGIFYVMLILPQQRQRKKTQEMLGALKAGDKVITNGGIYGSLMSTPILNPPQSAILGMHKIQQRPMAVGGEIKLRPMMYLAVSYDHRIIDGAIADQFMVEVKKFLENWNEELL